MSHDWPRFSVSMTHPIRYCRVSLSLGGVLQPDSMASGPPKRTESSVVTTLTSDLEAETTAPAERDRPQVDLRGAIAGEAPTLLAAARMALPNEADAWDVVATTMELALRNVASLRDPNALRSWMLVIEGREILKLRRRKGVAALTDVGLAGDDESAAAIERVALRAALASLPVRMRTAVVLHHMVGMSVADVARSMHVSVNTAKSEVKVGLVRLREVLRDG